jgi:hypothetical protein
MGTSDRREYLTGTTLDQAFLDRAQDALENGLEMAVDIETPDGTVYVSDRNKYVDGTFYEALTDIPLVRRSIGEWLSPEIEFSRLTLGVGNVDGRFNKFNPGGASFAGWIGKRVAIRMGLRDVGSTYTTIYSGKVTDIGGFQRDRQRFTLVTRDIMDELNKTFPAQVLTKTAYPDIEDNYVGVVAPVIYGDWTVGVNAVGASVPCYPVNGASAGVLAGTSSLRLFISEHDNTYLDTASVILKRGDAFYPFDAGDVSIVTGNRIIDIKQISNGGTTLVDTGLYQYTPGDLFYVKMKGKNLGSYSDNLVWQARDILLTYGGASSGDLDSNWATYRDKSSPASCNIAAFKSRVWIQEQKGAIEYVLSMLEQLRLEPFQDRNLKLKLFALHFDEFEAAPSFTVRNWDIEAGTLNPQMDERNVWNRARADYSFDPLLNENRLQTPIFKNNAAITQVGREIAKKVVFPNLYEEATVSLQLKEMLKLASGYSEFIEVTLTPRALLKDIGDFVLLNVEFGAIVYENVPAIIREIGYDAKGLRIPVKLWSLQMMPFPGYSPGYSGTVGGDTATITEET